MPDIVPMSHVARKFLALVDKTHANFTDLCESGRWTYYYSERGLVDRADTLAALRRKWEAIVEAGSNDYPSLRRHGATIVDSNEPPARLRAGR